VDSDDNHFHFPERVNLFFFPKPAQFLSNATSKEEIQIETIRVKIRRKACRKERKEKRKLIKEKLKVGLFERQSKNKRDIETDSRIQSPIDQSKRNETNQRKPGKPVDEMIK